MRQFRLVLIAIASLLVFCITLISCSTPVKSENTKPSPELEAQVLQIIRNNPQVILESVQAYQQQQQKKVQEARKSFLQQMTTNPTAVIAESPTTGAPGKKIVLLEFSDFQCPYCAQAHLNVKQFIAKHQDQVTLVYKNLPLVSIHPQALPAAKAAWAAGQQGKFWEYHNALFEDQKNLGEDLYVAIAKKQNLNLDKFNQDRNSTTADEAIKKDTQLAESLGISGTPFFFLNEEAVRSFELPDLEEALTRITKPR
jgi:protein-disulfide isomerase